MAFTQGVHHVGLTVPDPDLTATFFADQLGFHEVGRKSDYPAVFVSDGTTMLTLWQAKAPFRPFTRHHQIGLHHLALRVADTSILDEIYHKIQQLAPFEFAPEPLGTGGMRHAICRVPGGIRVEFIAPVKA